LETAFSPEIKKHEWQKTSLNAALIPVCASTGLTMKEAMDQEESRFLCEQIQKEGFPPEYDDWGKAYTDAKTRTESILNSMVWWLGLIYFAFLIFNLVVLGVTLLFLDISRCKSQKMVRDLEQTHKGNSYKSLRNQVLVISLLCPFCF